MNVQCPIPSWPRGIPRRFRPLATITGLKPLYGSEWRDAAAEAEARRLAERNAAIRCGGLTQSYGECFYSNRQDFTTANTFTAEATIIAGPNLQPTIPANYLGQTSSWGKTLSFRAMGVFGTTSTPTMIFTMRLGTTQGAADVTGTQVGATAAITTGSGVSNVTWYLHLDLTCNTPGQGATACTLSGAGLVYSPTGFASPFFYPINASTPPTATWTATINGAVAQYFNLSLTWSASSASNTITTKLLKAYAEN